MSEALKLIDETNTKENELSEQSPKTKEIVLPVLRSFRTHLTNMCLLQIAGSLNEQLVTGNLSESLGTTIVTEYVRAADMKIEKINCWRINQTDVETEIEFTVPLETEPGKNAKYPFSCSIWHSSDSWLEFEVEELKPLQDKPMQEESSQEESVGYLAQKLDIHGLPVFYPEHIPKAAVQVWRQWCEGALTDASLRHAEKLASSMNLSARTLDLYERPELDFILFFEDGEVEVPQERCAGQTEKPLPKREPVKAKTIVVNTAANRADTELAIYKACFAYHWDYIFYRLQGSVSTDPRQFRMKKEKIPAEETRKNPLNYLWLRTGAMNLMLPGYILEEKIRLEYPKARIKRPGGGYSNHKGFVYQNLAAGIAQEYELKPFRVKQRMNEIGHIAARGILHWEPDVKNYVPPYAVTESYTPKSKDEIFFITRHTLARLYRSSEELRKKLMAGDYVHVNGLVCVNDPEFVTLSYSGFVKTPKMTAWANAHVDQCCLSFKRTYDDDGANPVFSYVEDWNAERLDEGLRTRASMTWKQREEMKQSLIENMPSSFNKALSYLMVNNLQRRVLSPDLALETGIARDISNSYLKGENVFPSFHNLVKLCVAMSLPSWLSEPFIKTGGLEMPRQGQYKAWGQMFDCYYMLSVRDAMQYVNTYYFMDQEKPAKSRPAVGFQKRNKSQSC